MTNVDDARSPWHVTMLNDLDRIHLVTDVIDNVPGLGRQAAALRQRMCDERATARAFSRIEGEDAPAIRDWTWPNPAASLPGSAQDL